MDKGSRCPSSLSAIARSTRLHPWTLALALLAVLSLPAPAPALAEGREVIGRSVQGHPIVSISTGPAGAAAKVLVIGAVHGDEVAGLRIAQRLVAAGAPPGAQLTVVPTINPDGFAASTRGNARGVDLNRNFPFDWRPLGGGEYSGPRPLSEPEARAAYRLILRTRPDVTIWLHQPFGLVDKPRRHAFAARRFSELIGLPLVDLPGRYPGSASRWQNHRLPRSEAFVVELPRRVGTTFVARSVASVLILAAELGSPAVGEAG